MPAPSLSRRARVRPLSVRAGAAFACAGDGLCCTDIHTVGPLGRRDVVRLALVDPRVVVADPDDGERALATREDGACVFLGEGRCELHAAFGEALKPSACRRFPIDLVATPAGGRITTEHRCPCRTMGDRPALTAEAALPSIVDAAGRLRARHRVGPRVRIAGRRTVPFAGHEAVEADLRARLAAGEAPEAVLDREPFPSLRGPTWARVAAEMRGLRGGRRVDVAFQLFGDAIAAHLGQRVGPRPRPWAEAFDRAEARPGLRAPDEIFADFVADQLWAMQYTELFAFETFRRELATRLACGRFLYRGLRRRGLRADRAAAEAVMVLDVMGNTDWWNLVVLEMPDT